jgi:hypothetical protein
MEQHAKTLELQSPFKVLRVTTSKSPLNTQKQAKSKFIWLVVWNMFDFSIKIGSLHHFSEG